MSSMFSIPHDHPILKELMEEFPELKLWLRLHPTIRKDLRGEPIEMNLYILCDANWLGRPMAVQFQATLRDPTVGGFEPPEISNDQLVREARILIAKAMERKNGTNLLPIRDANS